jgi:hypothetical protein
MLKDQMARQLITYFPIGQALSIPTDDKEEEEIVEKVHMSMEKLSGDVNSLTIDMTSMSERVDTVQISIDEIKTVLSELASNFTSEKK